MSTLAKIPELVPPPIVPPVPTTTGPATTLPTTAPAASADAHVPIGDFVGPAILFAGAGALLLLLARRLGWWRDAEEWPPPRCPTAGRSGPLWLGLGVMIVVSFMLVPVLMAGMGFSGVPPVDRPRTAADDASQMIVTAAMYVVGLGAVAALHAVGNWRATLRLLGLVDDDRGPRRGDGWVVLVGLPILVVLTNLALIVTQVVWTLIGYRHETVHDLLQLMQRAEGRPGVLYLAVVNAVVLAPVFEEFFFRGHLQTALTALLPRRWMAIVLTSFLFAAMHGPWMIPPIFVLSLIVGYVYERTGNLWVAIAMHVGFNATSTLMFLATHRAM